VGSGTTCIAVILGAICYQSATKTWQVGWGLNRGGSAPSLSHLSGNLDQRPHLPPDSSYLPAVETMEELSDVGAFVVVLPPARNSGLSSAIGVQRSQPFGSLPDLIHGTTNRLRLGIRIERLARRNFVQAG